MKLLKLTILAICGMLFCLSCANLSLGVNYSEEHIQDIIIGHTTSEQLKGFFGQPSNKVAYEDVEVWEYFVITRSGYRQLVVSIKNDKVFSYAVTE